MDLSKFTGSIDQDDLELMEQSIAEECERIDTYDWLKQFNSLPDKSFYLDAKSDKPGKPD